ncbi:MAG: hypothetical protein ACOYT8_04080 [Candidatus Dependentiae bacterium]
MKFTILKKDGEAYYSTDVVSNDDYSYILMRIFTDRISFAKNIKKDLENPNATGRAGNEMDIDINNSYVTISYLYAEDEYIVINRQELIKILEKGIALMEANAPYISLIRENENAPIKVTDQLPEGMEFFVENKQLKARYKGKIYT